MLSSQGGDAALLPIPTWGHRPGLNFRFSTLFYYYYYYLFIDAFFFRSYPLVARPVDRFGHFALLSPWRHPTEQQSSKLYLDNVKMWTPKRRKDEKPPQPKGR